MPHESRVSFFRAIDGLDWTLGASNTPPANLMEAAGRWALRYQSASIDEPLAPVGQGVVRPPAAAGQLLPTAFDAIHVAEFAGDLEKALNTIDQPTFDGLNSYYISKAVREYCNDVRKGGFPSDAESYHAPQSTKDRKTIFIDS